MSHPLPVMSIKPIAYGDDVAQTIPNGTFVVGLIDDLEDIPQLKGASLYLVWILAGKLKGLTSA